MMCRTFGVHSVRVSGYSFRREGATWHFHRFGSVSLTAALGRGKQESTVRIYVESAAAEAASWQLSDSQSKLALIWINVFQMYANREAPFEVVGGTR